MNEKKVGAVRPGQSWPFWGASILSLVWVSIAVVVTIEKIRGLDAQDQTMISALIAMLTLNEWGDFLAGICGPLALIWIIASVVIQGMELKEQRAELGRQADALTEQSNYIRLQLERELAEKAWKDIVELLAEFRLLVPVVRVSDETADKYTTFNINGMPRPFSYKPKKEAYTEVIQLRDVDFLGRAAGGLQYVIKDINKALNAGETVECPASRFKFDKMSSIVDEILHLRGNLPSHRRIILEGCRLEVWKRHLHVLSRAFEGSRDDLPTPTNAR